MKRTREPFILESLAVRDITGYLQAEIAKKIKWQNDWDQPFITISIGPGCPWYPVEIAIHNLSLDRQAAIILNDLGIPDALDTSGSYRNFKDEEYLSISGASLLTFGQANKERILEWVAQREVQKPVMQQLHVVASNGGFGKKLDALLAAANPSSGGAS